MMSTADFRHVGHSDGGPRMESSQSTLSIMCAIPAHAGSSFTPNADTLFNPIETDAKLSRLHAMTRETPIAWGFFDSGSYLMGATRRMLR